MKIGKHRCLMLDQPVTTCTGNGCTPGYRCDDFDGVFLCAVIVFREMPWIRSGTDLSHRRIFLPTLHCLLSTYYFVFSKDNVRNKHKQK